MSSIDSTRRSSLNGSMLRSILSSQIAAKSSSSRQSMKSGPRIATPHITETQLGESIQFRTSAIADISDMGPADLIHVSKYHKHSKEESGDYHYCVGLDTSSIIQPFMYLQTIILNEKNTGTEKHPKVGTYCSYNCFSHGDLRIRCTFPGLTAPLVQFIPSSKQKIAVTIDSDETEQVQLIWKETYVSSLVRSLLFCDSVDRQLPGMCKFNPVPSTKDAKEAIVAMCELLPRGPLLDCNDLFNQPTLCRNYLVDALLKLIGLVGYYDLALEQIAKLEEADSLKDFGTLKVRILLDKGDQTSAVRLMHDVLKVKPRDGWMLQMQASFLVERNRPDLALIPARRSVECLPTEFLCWLTLIKVYILLKDYRNALLALNSSPMYSNKKKDIHAALKPKEFAFPFPPEGRLEDVWNNCESFGCISGFGGIVEFSPVNQINSISELHAAVYEQTKLQSTFREAYGLLAIMTRQLGWTDLLRIRSEIFVMEDEYNASVESEREREMKSNLNEQQIRGDNVSQTLSVPKSDAETRNRAGSWSSGKSSTRSLSRISSKFKQKRLSERWLDSLFLIFYENLKSVLIWENERRIREELEHSALEWELIGEECFKVRHYESGITPFQTALDSRFSIFACQELLEYYLTYSQKRLEFRVLNGLGKSKRERDGGQAAYMLSEDFVLTIVCKLISWNYRYYGEFSVLCLKVLKNLMELSDSDSALVKSKLEFLFDEENPSEDGEKSGTKSPKREGRRKSMEHRQGIAGVVSRYISWLDQF
ncbi:DEKNAAC104670 [Brettanomyces naardenensis]|uniref:DEKNAAC104670 n=1 Tax=Brettanomyces naardenensis TaxID=13370 RepID=A0A448YR22_BRENA|nr:DEKNAAC104670 [Brettanomyces naardenensis]